MENKYANAFLTEYPKLSDGVITLRKMNSGDAAALMKLTQSEAVYKYLPANLYENKYSDKLRVINSAEKECDSLLLGVYENSMPDLLIGIAELYDFNKEEKKVSIGCRLSRDCWGKGIAPRVVALIKDYLKKDGRADVITAHVMVENTASERVLLKSGFEKTASNFLEDWGTGEKVLTNKFVYKIQ